MKPGYFYSEIFAMVVVVIIVYPSICRPAEKPIMSSSIQLSQNLQRLFIKTKLVCFGRYALEVPSEAEFVTGVSMVKVVPGDERKVKQTILSDIEGFKQGNRGAEIPFNGEGPVPGSWQIRYFENRYAKVDGRLFFRTYLIKGQWIFTFGGSIPKGGDEASAGQEQALFAKNLRLRESNETPLEPGLCFDHGFLAGSQYEKQEMVHAGIFLPSFPDVTFSISSNKNAYRDYPPEEFENTKRAELSLLARIAAAKAQQGFSYPRRKLLREGKKAVQHWAGEESLIKRPDGVHDFEWGFVGTPLDVANPAEFHIHMYTKVKYDTVGAAPASSLSDAEAIALWDKLLSGLKFRVKVPGAPSGSYFFEANPPSSP